MAVLKAAVSWRCRILFLLFIKTTSCQEKAELVSCHSTTVLLVLTLLPFVDGILLLAAKFSGLWIRIHSTYPSLKKSNDITCWENNCFL